MAREPRPVASPRAENLGLKFKEPAYRHAYVAAHLRRFLGKQMRALRGDRTQVEFAAFLGEPQSSISTLEKVGPGTISKALDIAKKTDRALIMRFVDYDTFAALTDDQSVEALNPPAYEERPAAPEAQKVEAHQIDGAGAAPTDANVRKFPNPTYGAAAA
jgi:hypothetical protein